VNDLTHIDLFSGIGGFALAAGWAGFRTIVFCEIEPFCQEILKARFGAVADTDRRIGKQPSGTMGRTKRRDETPGKPKKPFLFSDIRNFNGTRFRGATLLTGGVPCQPASVAGKRRGTADDRWLWPEALRVFADVNPTWAIFENPPGILSLKHGLVFEKLLSQMEREGYEVWPVIIPACAVNAPHRRDRVWIIAHNESGENDRRKRGGMDKTEGQRRRCNSTIGTSDTPSQDPFIGRDGRRGDGDSPWLRRALQTQRPDSDAPDAEGNTERTGLREGPAGRERRGRLSDLWGTPWLEAATRLCRMDDGLPINLDKFKPTKAQHRIQRLKALGNAIVPQVAYQIIKGIAGIERRGRHENERP
jgi:DNA (cytosine-5)-methyltransferase 1